MVRVTPRIKVGLYGTLICLLGITAFALRSYRQEEQDAEWIIHAHEVLAEVGTTHASLQSAEANQRTYLLTNQERSLDSFQQASADCTRSVSRLTRLTGDNPRQQLAVGQLQLLVQEKLTELREAVQLQREGRTAAALALIQAAPHQSLTERIQKVLDGMTQEEQRLLVGLRSQHQRSGWLLWLWLGFRIVTTAVAVLWISRQFLRELTRRQQAEAALRASQAQFEAFMDHTPAVAFIKDVQGRIRYINAQMARLWQSESAQWLGKDGSAVWPPAVAQQLRETERALLAGQPRVEIVQSFPLPNGDVRQFLCAYFRFQGTKEETLIGSISLDITAQHKAARERDRLLAQMTGLLESVGNAIYGIDEQGRCVFLNRRAAELLGYSVEECLGREMRHLIHTPQAPEESDSIAEHPISNVYRHAREVRAEELFYRKDGSSFWAGYHARPLLVDGLVAGVIVTFADITEKRRSEEALAYHANYDALSGLANRRHFLEHLDLAMARAEKERAPLTLCIGDVDHFKTINDTHGHAVGDEVLAAFGQLLQEGVRQGDVPGRLGGDEFCIILSHTTLEQALLCVDRIRQRLATMAFGLGTKCPITVTATFGLAQMRAGMSREALLGMADDALYRAKRNGRNCVIHK